MVWAVCVLSVLLALALITSSLLWAHVRSREKILRSQKEKVNELEKGMAHLQSQTLSAAFAAQESERKRISADLHDEVGASLTAIKLNLKILYKSLSQSVRHYELFNDVFTSIDDVIRRNREIIRDISPSHLERFGLVSAIEQVCHRINQSYVTRAVVEERGVARVEITRDAELAIYRIVQELVINAAKYSNSWRVNIIFEWHPGALEILVQDNGMGISEYKSLHGMGLQNIHNRLSLIGGKLKIDKHYKGSSFLITIPLDRIVRRAVAY
jgi:two-component system NarL family sensor kinase